jgi:hypothetical protein
MTWFKVDDSFHAHPKVLATEADALGLWVIAGAWSSAHLTDGFVPGHALTRLLPDSDVLARKLVAAGLWRRTKGGYQFHDWSDFQPSANEVKAMREKRAIAGRKGGMASGKARSKSGSNRQANAEAVASPIVEPPTRPDPFLGGRSRSPTYDRVRAASEPPPQRCTEHQDRPSPDPCGRCGDARRTRERWDLADAERRRNAPNCRSHRGQPADNCALCRSEALAVEEDT